MKRRNSLDFFRCNRVFFGREIADWGRVTARIRETAGWWAWVATRVLNATVVFLFHFS